MNVYKHNTVGYIGNTHESDAVNCKMNKLIWMLMVVRINVNEFNVIITAMSMCGFW